MSYTKTAVPSGILSAAVSLLKPYFPQITEEKLTDAITSGGLPQTGKVDTLGEKLITRRQTADWLSISTRSVDYLIERGTLKAFRVGKDGKSVRIDPANVRALLAAKPVSGVTA